MSRTRSRSTQRLLRSRSAMIGLAILACVIVAVTVGPLLAPFEPNKQDLRNVLQGPSGANPLGTDQFGRDILARLFVGTRLSLLAALQAVVIAVVLGIPIGLLSGYLLGWLDAVASHVADALLSIPGLVLAFGIVGVLGPSLRNAMTAIGVILAPTFFRIARAAAADVRGETFVLAARSLGCSEARVLFRHILPNTAGPLLVQVSFATSLAIVGEASLSFIGLGARQPQASLGSMIADGYETARRTIWPIVPGSVVMMLVILALFFVGDGLEAATARDPSDRET